MASYSDYTYSETDLSMYFQDDDDFDDDVVDSRPYASKVELSKEATQRLLRDWKEVEKEPFHTVTAKPLEDNLSEWHCTLTPDDGPYQGTSLHLILTFPSNYPHSPPDVRISTRLRHPNVFGGSICLDMIKPAESYARPYRGWSTAYSVHSILLQLQSFLFAENVDQDYGGRARVNVAPTNLVESAKRDAAAFCCQACGFKGLDATVEDATVEDGTIEDGEATLLPPGVDHMDYESSRMVSDFAPTNVVDTAQHNAEAFRRLTCEFEGLQASVEDATEEDAEDDEATLMPPGVDIMALETFGRFPADHLSALPEDVLMQIMDRLDAAAMSALVRASKHFVRASTERGAWVRRELQCFHSKRAFTEEVLGFGIATKGAETRTEFTYCTCRYYGPSCGFCLEQQNARARPKRTGKWEGVLLMDYISAGAFFEGNVRKGVWNERLEWWLPLLLDDQHSARALPLLKGTIAALAANPRRPALPRDELLRQTFSPLDTLKVLPRLMNGMVVSFMKREGSAVDLHASEKALLGYCQLHHMLLRLSQEYPVIQERVDRALSRFQTDPKSRHKDETPDLGELLVLLSVAGTGGVTWASIASVILGENFNRNVLWLLKERPELAILGDFAFVSWQRMANTFTATATSRRLIMFQVATWPAYFAQLGIEYPGDLKVCNLLRQAVVSSSEMGYHTNPKQQRGSRPAPVGRGSNNYGPRAQASGAHRAPDPFRAPYRYHPRPQVPYMPHNNSVWNQPYRYHPPPATAVAGNPFAALEGESNDE